MSQWKVIESAKDGNLREMERLLAAGGDVDEQDDQGWTPLGWAAGRGDLDTLRFLLESGADVSLAGRDHRTPRMIARAADRKEAAELLARAEKERGVWVDPRQRQPYCKAYYLSRLRRFSGWSEDAAKDRRSTPDGAETAQQMLRDGDIVYVHQDFIVTRSMWPEEGVVFSRVTPEWREFCELELGFEIPGDLL